MSYFIKDDVSSDRPCEGFDGPCGKKPAKTIQCMTAYCNPEDNIDPTLCEECAEAYRDYWTEMWKAYWSEVFGYIGGTK